MLLNRLRRPSVVVALLMAVLLVAPTIDCALLGGDKHLHIGVAAATASTGASHDHHADRAVGHVTDDCDQHMSHCIVKSVLGSGAGLLLPLLWLVLAAVTAVGTAYLMSAGIGGVRGPPMGPVPVLNGQDILTRFCIARR